MSLELLIIGLHRVGFPPPEARIKGLFISPRLLEFHLSLIRQMGFRFTTLQEAAGKKHGKFAVITFDDGYADILTEGLPILRKYQAPATVFIITSDVGKQRIVWDEADERLPADLLNWSELKSLSNEGWEIGSHSHSHHHLSRRSLADREESIILSMEEICCNLGTDATSFAYPYGDYETATREILRTCGIKYAVTTKQARSLQFDGKTDFLTLPRVSFGGRKAHHYVKSLKRMTTAASVSTVLRGLNRLLQPITIKTISKWKSDSFVQNKFQ